MNLGSLGYFLDTKLILQKGSFSVPKEDNKSVSTPYKFINEQSDQEKKYKFRIIKKAQSVQKNDRYREETNQHKSDNRNKIGQFSSQNRDNVSMDGLKRKHQILRTINKLHIESSQQEIPNQYDKTFQKLHREFKSNDDSIINKPSKELEQYNNEEFLRNFRLQYSKQKMQVVDSEKSDSLAEEVVEVIRNQNPMKKKRMVTKKKVSNQLVIQKFPYSQWSKIHHYKPLGKALRIEDNLLQLKSTNYIEQIRRQSDSLQQIVDSISHSLQSRQ